MGRPRNLDQSFNFTTIQNSSLSRFTNPSRHNPYLLHKNSKQEQLYYGSNGTDTGEFSLNVNNSTG
jgi:hypothetical protein